MERENLDAELAYSLQQVKLAADRAAALTKQLLAFSRKQVMQRKPLHLAAVVQHIHPMLVRLVGESLALECHCQPNLPPVFADEHCLEQIIMNLVVNARDASSNGGVIRIQAEIAEVNDNDARRCHDARAGKFVCLKIKDCGTGIDTSLLNRVFEPFFTTKQAGKGTGLGLSTVYGIARQHEGWVEVESKTGKGSTFSVFLPPSDKPVEPPSQLLVEKPLKDGVKTPRTILLAEDESAVRELVASALVGKGYKVLQAADGVEALRVWRTAGTAIDLLVTDMVMPNGITGVELAKRLLKESQTLKVLYISGYSAEVLENSETLTEGRNFLPKPFGFDKLLSMVERYFVAESSNHTCPVIA
jgi:two-component system, cell cycle sensor histidine kinase and response regulator CckA